jgi:MSHA biogenesis protein MshG
VAVFVYAGRRLDGALVESEIEAASAAEAAAQLRESEITPVRISSRGAAPSSTSTPSRWQIGRPRVGLEDLILLCRQLHRLSRAGIPIIRAIGSLAESTPNRTLAETLGEVATDLRGGRELSSALHRHPQVFPSLFTSVVQVGETTGRLDDAYLQLSEYLERERETRRQIKSAMRYPTMVLVAIVGAMVLINVFVIPAFARVFEGFGAELPWATRVLMETSRLTIAYWQYGLGLVAAAVTGVRAWMRTPAGRLTWDRWRLRLPLVGRILYEATLGRYARSFAMSVSAGVPILQALGVVARAVDNGWFAERVLGMRGSLERGESLTNAAAASGLFATLYLHMLSVGEESGALAEMHREIAESCEAEVEYELKRMSDLIEPILIVAIGAVVFVLALGVYLPMWDLARAAKGGG